MYSQPFYFLAIEFPIIIFFMLFDFWLYVGVVMDCDPNSSSQNVKALNKL
jgi:hypothetical protein